MTDTIASTAPSASTTRTPRIKHFTWLSDWRASYELGIEVPSVCGRKWEAFDTPGPHFQDSIVQTVGGFVINPETRDCKLCTAALERQRQGRNRCDLR